MEHLQATIPLMTALRRDLAHDARDSLNYSLTKMNVNRHALCSLRAGASGVEGSARPWPTERMRCRFFFFYSLCLDACFLQPAVLEVPPGLCPARPEHMPLSP